ncbi:MAG: UDP-2,3-diacylglucosamine diphosphatase LpxI [Planctomycetota bacterium]
MTGGLTILADPPPPPMPVGVIAGGGRLPVLIARSLSERGHVVHGLGLAKQYDADLPALCDTFDEAPLLRLGAWAKSLKRRGVRHAIMVGRVDKSKLMHDPWRLVKNIPDARTLSAWFRRLRHDKRSHAVLATIAEELDRDGVSLIDSTAPIPHQLAATGVMTRTQPTLEQAADIEFVWPLLTELLRLDVGQALTVKERDVLAVEAVEGTDRMIERSSGLCKCGGWTLCKGIRAGHDRRSDVPTVGVQTIQNMHIAGGRCLALAASDVIMVDREEMIELANRLGVAIVGVPVGKLAAPKSAGSAAQVTPAGGSSVGIKIPGPGVPTTTR